MKSRPILGRKLMNWTVNIISALASCVGLFFLFWILLTVFLKGGAAINWDFFSKMPAPVGEEGGGLVHAFYGTLMITLFASVIGVPIGLMAGIYMAEFGMGSKFSTWVRFFSNILMGTPSIIIGVFIYTVIVKQTQQFSGYAGALALAVIMLPLVARTTEDILNLVPNQLREAGLGMGAPRWKVTLDIVFREARTGLLTGVLLAIARVSGETAPLLFTALNNSFWKTSMTDGPMPNLTVTIFQYAMSPYESWQKMAWGASLVITVSILLISIITRFVLQSKKG